MEPIKFNNLLLLIRLKTIAKKYEEKNYTRCGFVAHKTLEQLESIDTDIEPTTQERVEENLDLAGYLFMLNTPDAAWQLIEESKALLQRDIMRKELLLRRLKKYNMPDNLGNLDVLPADLRYMLGKMIA
jgi:hypothetical protein